MIQENPGRGEALDAPSISARFEKLELLVTALKLTLLKLAVAFLKLCLNERPFWLPSKLMATLREGLKYSCDVVLTFTKSIKLI